jgi:large subunit ribosomal protein L15
MVLRVRKKRKYFGTRRWGAGNIKNRRGSGDKGGVGRGGRKHKMTYLLVYERQSLAHKGFSPFRRKELKEIDLNSISKKIQESNEQRPVIELNGYKVLGDGRVERPVVVKASGFSKTAEKKIKDAGGEAIKL